MPPDNPQNPEQATALASNPPRFFYGYWLSAYSFIVTFLASSFFLHSRGIYFPFWMEEFDADRTDISLVITLTLLTSSILAPVIGYLIDRFPIKWVSIAGAIWMATGYLLLQTVESFLAFAVVLIAFQGVAWGTLGPLVQTKLMVNWFSRNRGMALGMAIMGLYPDGDGAPPPVAKTAPAPQTNVQMYLEFLTSREFWSVVLTFGMMNGVYSAMITHLPS